MIKEKSTLFTRQTLLKKVKEPHAQLAWEEFVAYYEGFIANVIRRKNIDFHDAQEIQQNVLLKLWKTLPRFNYDKDKGSFRGWITEVTKNEIRYFFRSKKEHIPISESLENKLQGEDFDDFSEIVEEEWRQHLAKMAWKNIEPGFNEKVRTTFLMLSKGVPVAKVAEKVQINESTVYVYKKRVKERLQAEIIKLKEILL